MRPSAHPNWILHSSITSVGVGRAVGLACQKTSVDFHAPGSATEMTDLGLLTCHGGKEYFILLLSVIR